MTQTTTEHRAITAHRDNQRLPDKPAHERITALFAKHGLPPPPVGLRDELVCHLVMHDRCGGYRP